MFSVDLTDNNFLNQLWNILQIQFNVLMNRLELRIDGDTIWGHFRVGKFQKFSP